MYEHFIHTCYLNLLSNMQLSKNCFVIRRMRRIGPIGRIIKLLVEVNGFEPMTPCVQGRCSPS